MFKAKPARKIVRARPVKAAKDADIQGPFGALVFLDPVSSPELAGLPVPLAAGDAIV